MCRPWISFFVMTLITPAMASAPYVDEAPSRSTSMRSTMAFGMVFRSTKLRWPSSASGYGARRRPSATDSVACTVRQRRGVGAGREVEARVPALLDGAGVVRREALNRLGNSIDTAFGQRVRAEHRHRRRRLRISTAENGSRDDHFLHRLIFGCWCFLREHHGGHRPTGRDSGSQQRTANRTADQVFT